MTDILDSLKTDYALSDLVPTIKHQKFNTLAIIYMDN